MTTSTADHVTYLVRHADDCLVLAQRLGEWSSRAPDLEEDIALTNTALDLLGQARSLYTMASEREGGGRTEDDFAYFRTEREFSNLLLVEQPNGDFGLTMARQLFFDAYQLSLWESLSTSSERTLAGIAAKAVKETRYHFRHSSAWVIRLGDGTAESHDRMQAGIDALWRFTGELHAGDELDRAIAASGFGADPAGFAEAWDARIDKVLGEATLHRPEDAFQRTGGRTGVHTEHLGLLLAEMQVLQRTYPGLVW
ncbi:MAG: phenylacetate-CoA oxygenase subunit PaaC [Acidimicrobiia bacterium]|nr:phenylacetate-CoA oxygenase subunit PaaC [Acidimicrobiia bacterium]